MKIYIAGKVSGDPDYVNKFAKAEQELRETSGCEIVNPVREAQKEFIFPEKQPWSTVMQFCLKLLSGCTHIYMLSDYYKSTGACIELEWARKCGLEIIFEKEPGKAA